MRDGAMFDYTAKSGQHRAIVVRDGVILPVVRALAHLDNGLGTLFCYQHGGAWHRLHSHTVNDYIAQRAGGHFTAKEFRTWNATVLIALILGQPGAVADPAGPAPRGRGRRPRGGRWLGDTPGVTRGSYIDPRLIARCRSDGQLPRVPEVPSRLPAPAEVEAAIATLLAGSPIGPPMRRT